MRKHNITAIILAIITICLIAALIVQLFPLIREVIKNVGDESVMVSYIDSYGVKGIFVLVGLQALQVIIAVVPSIAIQMLTGFCYGAYWGTLINIIGCVLGNILVFVAVRQMKNLIAPILRRNSKRKKIFSEKFQKIKRPEIIAFFFFLIPGIPNGIVPYVFAETKVSLSKYITAVVAGSIPSTFICTFLGDHISKGNFTIAIIIIVVVFVIVLIVLIFQKKIMAKITHE